MEKLIAAVKRKERIRKAELSQDGETFTLTFFGGESMRFEAFGDCCSESWIEHLEAPKDLEGALLTGYEEIPMSDEWLNDDEYQQVYESRFLTDRGPIVLEFRNNSNGYYGGSLELVWEGYL